MNAAAQRTRVRHIVRLYLRAAQLVWAASPRLVGSALLLILLTAATAPLQLWIAKLLIDHLVALSEQGGSAHWPALLAPLLLYVGIWAVTQSAHSLLDSLRDLITFRTVHATQRRILAKAAALDVAFFENPAFYDQLSLARREVWRLANISFQLSDVILQAITLLTLLLLLGRISPVLPALLLLTALPNVAARMYFTRQKAELYMRNAPDERMIHYLAGLLSDRDTVKEIRLFQLQPYLLARHQRVTQHFFQHLARITVGQERAHVLLTLLSLAGVAAIWGIAGRAALAGRITLGDIALVFQAVERSRAALDGLAFTGGMLVENTVYLQALFRFIDLPPDAVDGALLRPAGAAHPSGAPTAAGGRLAFHQVSFRYPGTEQDVLHDLSFTIEAGETVALVGENGAGKTTLVKLLARLYDPTAGTITLDGRDLRTVDPAAYHRQIGVIFQDFARYQLTARENIGFGAVDALDARERIQRAAERGGAAELIARLPQQYETLLGRQFDGSIDLSGGEWQRVALARAFMREAGLLILDEPTAALDAYAESEVYERFAELTRGRTTLFVTHRLSSVRMAGRILVLKAGRLVEVGSHAELMERNGEYARMFTLQADRYQAGDHND